MRIAHVVAYVAADGAFGGPVAVLRAQVAAIAARGHDVEVLAGWDGEARLEIPGVRVRLFRARQLVPGAGFSGLAAPGLARAVAQGGFDVVHVHLGRHLIALQAAQAAVRSGARLVVQPHGMVMPSTAPKAVLTDRLATRGVLAAAASVLVLTEREEQGVQRVARGPLPVLRVANGVAVPPGTPVRTGPRGREVLFLARLHPRKRVLAYATAAQVLRDRGAPARFAVVGPDEGDLAALQRLVHDEHLDEVVYEGSLPGGAGTARIAQADVYVLPAEREVFPMSVLEAMSVGTPVVLAEDCGIAEQLRAEGAAVVVDGSPQSIADAVQGLLDDPAHWRSVADQATAVVRGRLSIEAVTDTVLSVYAGTAAAPGAGRSIA